MEPIERYISANIAWSIELTRIRMGRMSFVPSTARLFPWHVYENVLRRYFIRTS
jgi:hypothetical protein